MAQVAENDAAPDIYSWHQIGGREPDSTIPDFNTLREQHSLPQRPIDINEYASLEEQNPANAVFYLAQLERYNLRGLRANWGGGAELHDFMANLVFRDESDNYLPNGEWYIYKYYAEMSGDKLQTTSSSDKLFDVFATSSGGNAKILAGTRTKQAPYEIQVSNLSSLGLPEQGSVSVHGQQFDWAGQQTDTGGPVDLGVNTYEYSDNTVSWLLRGLPRIA